MGSRLNYLGFSQKARNSALSDFSGSDCMCQHEGHMDSVTVCVCVAASTQNAFLVNILA